MITSEDISRHYEDVEIDWLPLFCLAFAYLHLILYIVFVTEVATRTSVFHDIEGDLMFNISEFGRLMYKVFDIYDYFL
ncbi:MAG: hypothetical protein KAR06_09380 [Deltaproteobacteria bacterium]|nr:hypothetical protein [Deltaproteobacteria bacterium]